MWGRFRPRGGGSQDPHRIGVSRRRHGAYGASRRPDPDAVGRSRHDRVGPIADPVSFFTRIAHSADAVVIDHFIEGDGSADGSRTVRTPLPAAMVQLEPQSIALPYRDEIVAIARRIMPGRVGVSADGFAGRFS